MRRFRRGTQTLAALGAAGAPPSGYAYESWTGPGWFDFSDTATLTLSSATVPDEITAIANKRVGNGNLITGGTAGKITSVAAAQNGRAVARLVRDVSSATAIPRMTATTTDAVSTMFQGDDKPFTVIAAYKPTDTNGGYIWSASRRVDSTDSQRIVLISRDATACGVSRQLVTATSGEVSWGSGQASGSWRVVCVKHSGTALTVWDNSLTKALDAAAQDTATFTAALAFALFAAQRNGGSDPAYQNSQRNMDFGECVVENSARSDADCQQAITDIATKWGITLS